MHGSVWFCFSLFLLFKMEVLTRPWNAISPNKLSFEYRIVMKKKPNNPPWSIKQRHFKWNIWTSSRFIHSIQKVLKSNVDSAIEHKWRKGSTNTHTHTYTRREKLKWIANIHLLCHRANKLLTMPFHIYPVSVWNCGCSKRENEIFFLSFSRLFTAYVSRYSAEWTFSLRKKNTHKFNRFSVSTTRKWWHSDICSLNGIFNFHCVMRFSLTFFFYFYYCCTCFTYIFSAFVPIAQCASHT